MVCFTVAWGKKIGGPTTVRSTQTSGVYEYEHFGDSHVEQLGSIEGKSVDVATAAKELSFVIAKYGDKASLVKYTITDKSESVTTDGWARKTYGVSFLRTLL